MDGAQDHGDGLERWIAAARVGDREALDRVLRHYLPAVRRWALVHTGDRDDAEDVVQRALMAAFRGIRKFREESSLPTWLYRITLNASRELYRNRKARTRALERYRRGAEDEAGTVSEEDDSELRPLVRKFLEELTERQRGMMDLVDLQGYTPAEAAEMLGLNPNTARVHLLRARRHMRASLLARKPHVLEDLR